MESYIKMNDSAYFELDADSQSSIKLFMENKKAYEYTYIKKLGEDKKTKALDLGTLNHCLLFENEEFTNRYAHFNGKAPNSPQGWKFLDNINKGMNIGDAYVNSYSCSKKSTNAIIDESQNLYNELTPYICFMKDNSHKEMITSEEELLSRQMIEIVYEHEGVRKTLLANRYNKDYDNYRELVIIWNHYSTPNRPLKCKIDEVSIDIENQVVYAYDYKTTRNKNIKSFIGSVKYYGYDIQMSFYTTALKYWLRGKYGKEFQVIFRFIPQLNVAPYNVLGVVELSDYDREQAYLKWTDALSQLEYCIRTGEWDNEDAYSESGVTQIQLSEQEINIVDSF